jgi:hypothetical protein
MTGLGAAYQPLGAEIGLRCEIGSDVERALQVWEELSPVAAPLALTLLLGSYERETGWPDAVEPSHSSWQITERPLPSRVEIDWPQDPNLRRSSAPSLNRHTLERWMREALSEPSPVPGHVTALSSVHCTHVRAPVSDEGPDSEGYRLLTVDGVFDFPVEHRGGWAYVLAPADGVPVQPPIGWTLLRTGDLLRADVTVNWSPWLELDRPEGLAAQAAARRLQARGWTLVTPVPALELVP